MSLHDAVAAFVLAIPLALAAGFVLMWRRHERRGALRAPTERDELADLRREIGQLRAEIAALRQRVDRASEPR